MIGRDLAVRRATVIAADSESVRVVGDDGKEREIGVEMLVGMVKVDDTSAGRDVRAPDRVGSGSEGPDLGEGLGPLSVLELVDGQRWYGRVWGVGSGDAGSLVFIGPLVGRVRVPLDRVSRLALGIGEGGGGVSAGRAGSGWAVDDVVVLGNGDKIDGFVLGIGSQVRIERGREEIGIPIGRVADVRLATQTRRGPGPMVWFDNGSVMRGSLQAVAPGLIEVVPDAAALGATRMSGDGDEWGGVRRRLERVGAVVFDGSLVVGWSSLELAEHEAGAGRRWIDGPRIEPSGGALLGAGRIELSGPSRARWKLPEGASRVGAVVELPERFRVWGDVEVAVSWSGTGGQEGELTRVRLNGSRPVARLNETLPSGARELIVVLEQAGRGMIQDRIAIERGLILLGP